MLDYFKEVRVSHPDVYKSEFILWSNKYIYFYGHLFERGICSVQGLLDGNGKFLSIVQVKHNVHLNFL